MNEEVTEQKIEELMNILNNHYGANESYQKNEGMIRVLLFHYLEANGDTLRLKNFLSELKTIQYLQDKDMLMFIEALVNMNNDYGLSMEEEIKTFDILFDVSKNYIDVTRGRIDLYDNYLISKLVELYINYGSCVDSIVKKIFMIFINNNFDVLSSYCGEYDDVTVLVNDLYQDFIRDEYFKNYNFYNHDSEINNEKIYNDISDYIKDYFLSFTENKSFK